MKSAEAAVILKRDNPRAKPADIAMYADFFANYFEATDNIARNGTIVAHPRTGSPIDNPYLKVQAAAMLALRKFTTLRTDALWRGEKS